MTVAVDIAGELGEALSFAFGMFWEILCALILGFALSGAVQAVVSKGEMRRLLPDDSPRSIALGSPPAGETWAPISMGRDIMRLRFAPSPTGSLHIGGARTALYNWLLARHEGATLLLRIEDTDASRNRPEWTDGIVSAMAWLGMDASGYEGPVLQ